MNPEIMRLINIPCKSVLFWSGLALILRLAGNVEMPSLHCLDNINTSLVHRSRLHSYCQIVRCHCKYNNALQT